MKCQWKFDQDYFKWDTDCGNAHQFMDEGPKANHYKYCPYCGRKVMEFTDGSSKFRKG